MVDIRKLRPQEVGDVVKRVVRQLRADATKRRYVNPETSENDLRDALASSAVSTWVALDHGRIVGHLHGALLENVTHGSGVWVGPDGVSFDSADVLDDLYAFAGQEWIDMGAIEHFVWVVDDPASTSSWFNLGFSKMHARGVMALDATRRDLPHDYALRRGGLGDIDIAIDLDSELDEFQRAGPSFSLGHSTLSQRDEWLETLSDPDARHYIVEHEGVAVAQCVTFPLPRLRGTFERTIHLSAVLVRDEHRRRGVASAMICGALIDAHEEGFHYAETSWRVTNRRADRFWKTFGFETTYVRLHRTIGRY